jgi:D-3-phosphoglycerate dehydrogenase / 2-oxoglutarate reductase
VMNDPISNGRSVVEMVFGQMICLARRIFDANEKSHSNIWTKDNKQRFELRGKTLGILGLGNIGKQVAQMGEAFGMEIVFWDDRELAREVGSALGWRCCPTLTELFRQSDVISVHVSAENGRGQSNRELLKYEHFAAMAEDRPSPSPRIFINAARGFLYDPEHLKQALTEGKVLSAAVDVFPVEPGGKLDAWENPYAAFPQVVTTPHIGAATLEAQPRIGAYVAGTTRLFDESGRVRSCVYAPGQSIGVDVERPNYVLTVMHSDKRGTKKAISDSIFSAGLNNLESSHRDFSKFGVAYDVSAMDRPLTDEQIVELIQSARSISGDPSAIRAIRQIALGPVAPIK